MNRHGMYLLAFAACLLALAGSTTAIAQATVDKLSVAEPNRLNDFGDCVSIAKKIAVVGSPGGYTAPDPGTGGEVWNGAAYVFRKVGAQWVEEARLAYEGAASSHFAVFGRSCATDGSTIVVGAPLRYGGGAAYVFEQVGGAWTQTAELRKSRRDGSNFGWAVAVEEDSIVVGAPNDGQGKVFVFRRDPNSGEWAFEGELEPIGGRGATGTQLSLGRSVSISRGRIAAGAPGHDGPGDQFSDMGAAFVFRMRQGAWEQEAMLVPSDGQRWYYNGEAVAIDRKTVVVGSRGSWMEYGAAYIYELRKGTWEEAARLDPSLADEGDWAGADAVAIHGRRIVLGARLDDEAGGNSGSLYLFLKRGKDWVEEGRILPPDGRADHQFAGAVSVFRRFVLAGAYRGDTADSEGVGAAYVIK